MTVITTEMLEELFAKGDGWDALENLQAKAAGDQALLLLQARGEASIVSEALSTPAGRLFLNWLIRKTLLRPPTEEEQVSATEFAYVRAKARRDGQNGVVWMILHALEVARDGTGKEQVT